MKGLIRIALFAGVLILSTGASAQYLWLRGGLNLANQLSTDDQVDYNDLLNFSNRIGWHAGFIGGLGIGPVAGETGIMVSTRGYNYNFEEPNFEFSGYTNLVYIDVPLHLKLRARLGGTGVFLNTGPVFSFGIGGTFYQKTNMIGGGELGSEETEIKWGDSNEDHYKRTDIGYALGGGLELGKISLSAQYIWGLSNVAAYSIDGLEIKNRTLQFTLGFKLIDL